MTFDYFSRAFALCVFGIRFILLHDNRPIYPRDAMLVRVLAI